MLSLGVSASDVDILFSYNPLVVGVITLKKNLMFMGEFQAACI
jgi:hypothetical protein